MSTLEVLHSLMLSPDLKGFQLLRLSLKQTPIHYEAAQAITQTLTKHRHFGKHLPFGLTPQHSAVCLLDCRAA